MKKAIITLFALAIIVLIYNANKAQKLIGNNDLLDSSCVASQPTDLYYDPQEYYKNHSHLIETDKNGNIQPNTFSTDTTHYSLRPLHTELVVPRNFLKKYVRRCAKPYALKYWDLIFLEVLLPRFEPKTEINHTVFSYQNAHDVLTIRAGSLTSDIELTDFMRNVERGKYKKINKKNNITEYILNNASDGNLTSYYVYDNIKTISEKPLLLKCSHGTATHKSQVSCRVNLFLPKELWGKNTHAYEQMEKGLEVSYWFKYKHIENLKEIHEYVIDLSDQIFIDIDILNK